MSLSFVAVKSCDLCDAMETCTFDHLWALAEVPAYFTSLGWVRSESTRQDACPACVKSITETREQVSA